MLGLDLGTSTGWALRTTDDYTSSGTVLLKHSRYDGGGMRFLRFRRWLEDLDQDAGPIEAIYFEEVRRHAGTDAAHIYGGLLAVLSAWCEEHLVAYQGVPVGRAVVSRRSDLCTRPTEGPAPSEYLPSSTSRPM